MGLIIWVLWNLGELIDVDGVNIFRVGLNGWFSYGLVVIRLNLI